MDPDKKIIPSSSDITVGQFRLILPSAEAVVMLSELDGNVVYKGKPGDIPGKFGGRKVQSFVVNEKGEYNVIIRD